MHGRVAAVVLALLAIAEIGAADGTRLVDTVLAEVGSSPVTLSDVTLARALGIFGLWPSDGPVTDAELTRYLDARLAAREATQLAIDVPTADVDRAWEMAGGRVLAARLEGVGLAPAWARQLLETDLRIQRFVDLRFRAFAFVSDFDVEDALGPGAHDEAARARTRERLRADMVARAFAAWAQDARQRVAVRRIPGVTGPWPAPFSLPSGP